MVRALTRTCLRTIISAQTSYLSLGEDARDRDRDPAVLRSAYITSISTPWVVINNSQKQWPHPSLWRVAFMYATRQEKPRTGTGTCDAGIKGDATNRREKKTWCSVTPRRQGSSAAQRRRTPVLVLCNGGKERRIRAPRLYASTPETVLIMQVQKGLASVLRVRM